MQVTVEKTSDLGRKMTIVVEDANIEEKIQQQLESVRPTARMAGFRPGKVPLKMLAKTHG
ncbi:MAG: trigger factor, partial [Bradymonadaceae bacterium]